MDMQQLLSKDILVPILIAGGVITIVTVKTIASVLKTNAREKTRREIAAYIAEGTMTPEQGDRLMRSGGQDRSC